MDAIENLLFKRTIRVTILFYSRFNVACVEIYDRALLFNSLWRLSR